MENTDPIASTPESVDVTEEDLETLRQKIADQMSELSAATEVPLGQKAVLDPFEASEVDFTSNGWLLRLAQIQGWLHPDSDLTEAAINTDALSAVERFFRDIGATHNTTCVLLAEDKVQLTPLGAEHLSSRLDTAVSLQQEFSAAAENSNRREATKQWAEHWEEADNEPELTEPIRAKSEAWKIGDFIGKAKRGLLNLNPSYQRGDVWPTRDAQRLIESILRGIPLPSIIILKPRPTNKDENRPYEVVDGKQRLTTILRFTGNHPAALRLVKEKALRHPEAKLEEHFTEDYKKFRRLWKRYVGETLSDRKEAEYYFPFRLPQASRALVGPLAPLAGRYYCEIRNHQINGPEGLETICDVFDGPSDYKIALIQYNEASPRQIHDVFHLYNRQGKHLNAEEIRNAVFHDVDLVRLVLAASGDNSAVDILAPYLPNDDRELLPDISTCLTEYRFGFARYKRTKLLSWMFALLFQPSIEDDVLRARSTATHTDSFFKALRDTEGHPLALRPKLTQLMRDTARTLEAHSSVDCWDLKFKDNDSGTKWQELQLVASLTGVFLLSLVSEDLTGVLEAHRERLLDFTKQHPRPVKTQNKEQWTFIGQVALGIVEAAEASMEEIQKALIARYGTNGLATLRAARREYRR